MLARLKNPATAAIFAAIVTLVVRYADHRISKKPDYLVDYIKAMGFVAAIVFFVVRNVSTPSMMMAANQTIMNAPF